MVHQYLFTVCLMYLVNGLAQTITLPLRLFVIIFHRAFLYKLMTQLQKLTSFTLMMGETVGGITNRKRHTAQAWLTAAYGRIRGDVPFGAHNSSQQLLGDGISSSEFGFGSKHDEGVNFVLADASLLCLKRNVDSKILYALAGISDRDPINRSLIAPFISDKPDRVGASESGSLGSMSEPADDQSGSDEKGLPTWTILALLFGLGTLLIAGLGIVIFFVSRTGKK